MRFRWQETPSPAQIAAIANEIETAGFCRIDDFLDPEELAGLAGLAETAVENAGNEYFAFGTERDSAGTIWLDLVASPALRDLGQRLFHYSTGKESEGLEFHPVFRCLKGKSATKHSLYFHFDSYMVTILIPVAIPASGQSGDFVMFPSARPLRRTYWRNVIDKVICELAPMQYLYRRKARSSRSKIVRVPLLPGTAIIFWGYRSLHANEPCDPDKLRATALLHFGNPHGRSHQTAK